MVYHAVFQSQNIVYLIYITKLSKIFTNYLKLKCHLYITDIIIMFPTEYSRKSNQYFTKVTYWSTNYILINSTKSLFMNVIDKLPIHFPHIYLSNYLTDTLTKLNRCMCKDSKQLTSDVTHK